MTRTLSKARAQIIKGSLGTHTVRTLGKSYSKLSKEDREIVISEFLADIFHLLSEEGLNPKKVLISAREKYNNEK